MPTVEMYTSFFCPFCTRAKSLLKKKAVEFSEIGVDSDPALRQQMTERCGGARTVPQIFIGKTHVGGCDELYALEQQARLDCLLKPQG